MLGIGNRHLGNAQHKDHFRRTITKTHAALTVKLPAFRLYVQIDKLDALLSGHIAACDAGCKRERRIAGFGGHTGRRSGKHLKAIGGAICIALCLLFRAEGAVELRLQAAEHKAGRFDLDLVAPNPVFEAEAHIAANIIHLAQLHVDAIHRQVSGQPFRLIAIRRKS